MSMETLRDGIYWVGYVDWDVRDFHGYKTSRGSTYNAYLIMDEKIAVIDSVKAPYADALLANIARRAPLEEVDYVVCNHAEPDHSGSLPVLMAACPQAELVCNAKCKDALAGHYDVSKWTFKIVDETAPLSLGKRSLKFINTPMAHWPESMFSYMPEEKLLFSMDAFGQHYATSSRFDDQTSLTDALYEAKKYYANIIMLYGAQVEKVLNRASGLDIEIIAPSHGVIWRKHLGEIVAAYKKWIVCAAVPKVLIVYDTMWQSTAKMAAAIYEGANRPGVNVLKYDLKSFDITKLATETLDAAALAVGSPTLNKGLMPKVAEALTYLRGLAPRDKAAMAFGSYGWAKQGGQHEVLDYLKAMNCRLVREEPIQCRFKPTEDVLADCRKAGETLAEIALGSGTPA